MMVNRCHFKKRFPPVFLKYNTCIITEIDSKRYINPTITINIGIFSKNADAATNPPNAREPVSP